MSKDTKIERLFAYVETAEREGDEELEDEDYVPLAPPTDFKVQYRFNFISGYPRAKIEPSALTLDQQEIECKALRADKEADRGFLKTVVWKGARPESFRRYDREFVRFMGDETSFAKFPQAMEFLDASLSSLNNLQRHSRPQPIGGLTQSGAGPAGTAPIATQTGPRRDATNGTTGKAKCYNCREMGHYARKCLKPRVASIQLRRGLRRIHVFGRTTRHGTKSDVSDLHEDQEGNLSDCSHAACPYFSQSESEKGTSA